MTIPLGLFQIGTDTAAVFGENFFLVVDGKIMPDSQQTIFGFHLVNSI